MAAPWKIVRMNILPNYRLELTFVDGSHGIVDLSDVPFVGVFERMADHDYFAQATLVNGVVTWPCGTDIAPDALHEKVNTVTARPPYNRVTGQRG